MSVRFVAHKTVIALAAIGVLAFAALACTDPEGSPGNPIVVPSFDAEELFEQIDASGSPTVMNEVEYLDWGADWNLRFGLLLFSLAGLMDDPDTIYEAGYRADEALDLWEQAQELTDEAATVAPPTGYDEVHRLLLLGAKSYEAAFEGTYGSMQDGDFSALVEAMSALDQGTSYLDESAAAIP